MKKPNFFSISTSTKLWSLFLFAFILFGCQSVESDKSETSICDAVTDIVGEYKCSGECVITDKDGKRTVITVSGETDIIQHYPEAKESLYKVDISSGDFRELEIGVLTGKVLYTATAEVSDSTYPVLEEYVFDVDEDCKANGFTKIVRNPYPESFKACVINCKKN